MNEVSRPDVVLKPGDICAATSLEISGPSHFFTVQGTEVVGMQIYRQAPVGSETGGTSTTVKYNSRVTLVPFTEYGDGLVANFPSEKSNRLYIIGTTDKNGGYPENPEVTITDGAFYTSQLEPHGSFQIKVLDPQIPETN